MNSGLSHSTAQALPAILCDLSSYWTGMWWETNETMTMKDFHTHVIYVLIIIIVIAVVVPIIQLKH